MLVYCERSGAGQGSGMPVHLFTCKLDGYFVYMISHIVSFFLAEGE